MGDITLKVSTDTKDAEKALDRMTDNVKDASGKMESFGDTTRKTNASMTDTVTNLTNVANSAFFMYQQYDRIKDVQLAVDRANLKVSNDLDLVAKAQDNLNKAMSKYGEGSAEAIQAAKDLADAQEKLRIDTEAAENKQNDLNKSIVSMGLTAIPQTIAMVANLRKTLSGLNDVDFGALTSKLAGLSSSISGVAGGLGGLAALAPAAVALPAVAAGAVAVAGTALTMQYMGEEWGAVEREQFARTYGKGGTSTVTKTVSAPITVMQYNTINEKVDVDEVARKVARSIADNLGYVVGGL